MTRFVIELTEDQRRTLRPLFDKAAEECRKNGGEPTCVIIGQAFDTNDIAPWWVSWEGDASAGFVILPNEQSVSVIKTLKDGIDKIKAFQPAPAGGEAK
jgi:CubicO group peptidase (beta-lactamase class C family)